MESTYLPEAAESEAEQPLETDAAPVPALIFLDSADDAGVCDVDGECV